jgi:thiamine-phosphate pyrophosphorylase
LRATIDYCKIDWSLYAILDKESIGNRSIKFLAEELIKGGAGIIQLRDKVSSPKEFYADAVLMKEVTKLYGIPLIINDRLDIAVAVQADGAHLGQQDLPLTAARRLVGKKMILGASVHNVEEFEIAMAGEPDYLGVGTIYPSPTKSELGVKGIQVIEAIRARTRLSLVGIGGITLDNLAPVIQAGADGVAVISALLNVDDVQSRAREFVNKVHALKQTMENRPCQG